MMILLLLLRMGHLELVHHHQLILVPEGRVMDQR